MKRSRTTSEFLQKYFLAGQKTHDDLVAKGGPPSSFDQFVTRHRKAISIIVPFVLIHIMYWLLAYKYQFLHLFITRYEMGLVMIFGAFVGGATAEGGGAIAFPIMTLVLKVSPSVARDFSVMIQSVGLNCAAFSIQMMGVLIESHTFIFASIGGTLGTIASLEFLDDALSPAVKKIAFVSVFFSFAIALYLLNKEKKRLTYDQIQDFNWWKAVVLMVTGFVGGLFSGIAGSGLEVFAFSVITLLFRINEKVATPTTVSLAGVNSLVTFFWRHFMQGTIQPLAWEYMTVCVPIVTFFAPIGSLISSHFHRLTLAIFIYLLETIALVSAFVILRPDWPLWLLSAVIIVISFVVFSLLSRAGEKMIAGQSQGVMERRCSEESEVEMKQSYNQDTANSASFSL